MLCRAWAPVSGSCLRVNPLRGTLPFCLGLLGNQLCYCTEQPLVPTSAAPEVGVRAIVSAPLALQAGKARVLSPSELKSSTSYLTRDVAQTLSKQSN